MEGHSNLEVHVSALLEGEWNWYVINVIFIPNFEVDGREKAEMSVKYSDGNGMAALFWVDGVF